MRRWWQVFVISFLKKLSQREMRLKEGIVYKKKEVWGKSWI